MTIHTIRQGECLSSIAKKYGFASWEAIYDHPDNEALRSRRPNPNLVFPGDEVFIPELQQDSVQLSTNSQHRIRVTTPKRTLHLAAETPQRTRLSNAEYRLEVGSKVYEGTTDGDGRLKEMIPALAERATLTVGTHVWHLHIAALNPIEDTDDEGVSGIQGRLKNLAYDPGAIDGKTGRRTKAAIRRFQANASSLKVDGICGPKTQQALLEAHGC
ncbi:MAG: peptidoglycan-binding protein [Deltaproteobacteria bacterium]|nr:peptidoglycan-binding protein [Deltaproteobacteria bacterium]